MPTLVSPGHAFTELDLSFYVPALSTTHIGFVGTSTKGLLDTETLITSAANFEDTFGKVSSTHLATYAARLALAKGRLLSFVRVAGAAAALATLALNSDASSGFEDGTNNQPFIIAAATSATVTGTEVGPFTIIVAEETIGIDTDNGGDETVILNLGARTTQQVADDINAGTTGLTASVGTGTDLGKLVLTSNTTGVASEIELDATITDDEILLVLGLSEGVAYNGTAGTDSLVVSVDGGGDITEVITAGTRTAAQVVTDLVFAGSTVSALSDGSIRIISDTTGTSSTIQVQATSTADTVLGMDNAEHAGLASGGLSLTVNAKNEGTWANATSGVDGLSIVVSAGTNAGTFKLEVFLNSVSQEIYDNLSKTPADTNFHETVINTDPGTTLSNFIRTVDNVGNAAIPSVLAAADLVSGDSGESNVGDADFIGGPTAGPGGNASGLQIFRDVDNIDVNILAVPGESASAVVAEVTSIVEARGDCLGVLDPPVAQTLTNALSYHNGTLGGYSHSKFNSSFTCIYWPWVKVFDAVNNINVFTPPSAHAIAVMTATDFSDAEWFAPAGPQRGVLSNALDIELNPTVADRDLMYDTAGSGNALNPIIRHPVHGITIWGQRTTQRTATALDRINVRRLILKIRKIAATAAAQVIFEPGDLITAQRFENTLEPALLDIQQRRGLVDFKIVADESVNTPEVLNRNEMKANIFLKPTKTAEFFSMNVILTEQGASFDEIAL